jgi:hypothetical protein
LIVGLLIAMIVAALASTTTARAATFSYDSKAVTRVDAHEFGFADASSTQLSGSREGFASLPVEPRRTSTTPFAPVVATEAAAPRFVVNGAGEALDTAQITIPGGKYGYLLQNPAKSGVFADSMGFDKASLDSALRSHLVDNFGAATPSVPMVGGGTKFSVTGPMVGPSGAKWTITTAWGVDPDGTIRLITATP